MNRRRTEVKELRRKLREHELREAIKMWDSAMQFLVVFAFVYLLAFILLHQ